MYRDVIDLQSFYRDRLGLVVQKLLRRRLRQMWPDVTGLGIMGYGYVGPLLKAFEEQAARRFMVMPALQGVVPWPERGRGGAVVMAHETELPFEDASIDRIILCHAVECAGNLNGLMREIWRVLAGPGRLMVVAPNRRGIWARAENTPFGHGVPFSTGQLVTLLRGNGFVPERTARAVYVPPVRQRFLLSAAPAWEEFGERWFEPLGGLNMVEASKQVFAQIRPQAQAQQLRQRIQRPVLSPVPVGPRPAPGFAQQR